MLLKRTLTIGTLNAVLLFNIGLIAGSRQGPIQLPKRFEIYYEVGLSASNSNSVGSSSYDVFDSEKKQRVFDAFGGQVTYQAQLTDDERVKIYQAISDNRLFEVKDDFTNLGNTIVHPNIVGRLRFDVDGRIKEIRFKRACGRLVSGGGVTTCDSDWPRLENVLNVIEVLLKAKDQKQNLPRHNTYA